MSKEPLAEVRSRFRDQALGEGTSPRDVDLLLCDLLGQPLAWIIAHGDTLIDPQPVARLLKRRFAGEPLQYIRGKTEFFSREFRVDERVLIPRPETEILVETVLGRARQGAKIVDVGTGTGCIAISLERTRRDLKVIALDVSVHALAVAHDNRRRHASRIALVASNILTAIDGEVDMIVSNPPYIAAAELEGLAKEVRQYEPRMALTPGPTGMEIIERILSQSRSRLAGDGMVILEIGYGQRAPVCEAAERETFIVEDVVPDLAGIDRVVVLFRRGFE